MPGLTRLSLLLAASCLGTGAALLAGRGLLALRPALTPENGSGGLERVRRWSPDPERRREAALLLHSRFEQDTALRLRLLQAQGWGADPLAAVVLKAAALDQEAGGAPAAAQPLWQQLRRRFAASPASADALYALGRRDPGLRRLLLERFPAHPAALAAALEAGPDAAGRLAGTLHLARWGARWPGADQRLQAACADKATALDPGQRAQLAAGLAELGASDAALRCLNGSEAAWNALPDQGRLNLARELLKGDGDGRQRGIALLVGLIRRAEAEPAAADEALRLLAQQEGPAIDAALETLPPPWRDRAPVAAHRVLTDPAGSGGLEVLRRWPQDPAAWELQWELARRQLLKGKWPQARMLLEAIPADSLPPPLAARQRFWLGQTQKQMGEPQAALSTWRELRRHQPGGYYGWRAAVQLGEAQGGLNALEAMPEEPLAGGRRWDPLASGDAGLDRLWRLDQRTEAWESWRQRRANRPPRQGGELLVEGRLRQGVGDDWTGFAQLEQASLRLKPDQCALLPALEHSLHPPRFEEVFQPWARRRRVPLALLLGLSKQESRFSPSVQSAAGAVGLMQLLPSTASELAGRPLSAADLQDPARNAELGSLYLRQLLDQMDGDPLPAVAAYNAGPGAVAGWLGPRLRQEPELWVEGIPFPETRLYVKKVLGNAWSYRIHGEPTC